MGDMDFRVGPTFERCAECDGTNTDGYDAVVHYATCSKAPKGKRAKMEPTRIELTEQMRRDLGLDPPAAPASVPSPQSATTSSQVSSSAPASVPSLGETPPDIETTSGPNCVTCLRRLSECQTSERRRVWVCFNLSCSDTTVLMVPPAQAFASLRPTDDHPRGIDAGADEEIGALRAEVTSLRSALQEARDDGKRLEYYEANVNDIEHDGQQWYVRSIGYFSTLRGAIAAHRAATPRVESET